MEDILGSRVELNWRSQFRYFDSERDESPLLVDRRS